MTNTKKSIDLFADSSDEAKNLAEKLENKGYEVQHILTASNVPTAISKSNEQKYSDMTSGLGQIRTKYGIGN